MPHLADAASETQDCLDPDHITDGTGCTCECCLETNPCSNWEPNEND